MRAGRGNPDGAAMVEAAGARSGAQAAPREHPGVLRRRCA